MLSNIWRISYGLWVHKREGGAGIMSGRVSLQQTSAGKRSETSAGSVHKEVKYSLRAVRKHDGEMMKCTL